MKILHIIPPVKFGGGEAVLYQLIMMGKDLGYDESVCCLYRSLEFQKLLKYSDIKYYNLSAISIGSGLSRLKSKFYAFLLLFYIPKLVMIIHRARPNVIHLHGFPSIMLGVFASKIYYLLVRNVPLVYTHHWVSAPKAGIESRIFRFLYSNVDFITAVSQASLDSLNRECILSADKVKNINNFAAQAFFDVGSNKKPPKPEKNIIRFINVARFTKFKNQISIVNAIAKLSPEDRSRMLITFVGDGEYLEKVKRRVSELNISNNVIFTGFIKHDKVPTLMANADVMIFPSHNEGSPIAIAEALASGLPILGLDICKPVVEVAGDAGIFVPESRLAEGISRYIKSDLVTLSEKAIKRSVQYNPVNIKSEYIEIYRKLTMI